METPMVVISREMVKPWSETPNHLKKLKLSYLDQLAPPTYSPFIFFIQSDQSKGLTISNHPQILHDLKHSLSHTLPIFYPLAGRLQDHSSFVDCNDEGVDFVHARARARLAEVIQDPDIGQLRQFLPMDPTNDAPPKSGALLLVQITFFDCGGVAVGICFWHQIADCTSVMAFINSWAALCRGEADQISGLRLSFNLAAYFPTRDFLTSRSSGVPLPEQGGSQAPGMTQQSSGSVRALPEYTKHAMKRFVFDKERLASLKQAAASVVKNPTRVELVSAFIWRSFLKAAKIKNPKAETKSAAFHVVNLRPREKILEHTFGNCTILAFAFSTTGNEGEGVWELGDLAAKLKVSIRSSGDGGYIRKAQSGDVYLDDYTRAIGGLARGEVKMCAFSSWCRFPVYEVDYGWGKPIWWCVPALLVKDLSVVLIGTRCGEGIEAWVSMDEEGFQMLEKEIQFHFECANVV